MTRNALARQPTAPMEFSPDQRKMILTSFLSGASESEAAVLLELARLRRLNPILGQIHFVKRWNAERQTETWAAQVGIDGFRAIADRTGLYDGQEEPEFEYPDGNKRMPAVCRVRVFRRDWSRPAVGVAFLSEYAQKKKDGSLTRMWAEKPHVMLAKCAEALAFRKAFPEDTSGLYAPEEDAGESLTEETEPAPTKRAEALKAKVAAKLGAGTTLQVVPVAQRELEPAAPVKSSPPRRVLIQDEAPAQPEPPPPGDADAPFVAAPEVQDDKPQMPPPAEAPMSVPFGRNKGKLLSELTSKDLDGTAEYLRKQCADPSKERYRSDNERLLRGVEAELARRTS